MTAILAQCWALATVISMVVCWRRSGGVFAFLALLLGPGAVVLTRAHSDPRLSQRLTVVASTAGLSVFLFLVTCLFFPDILGIFQEVSLEQSLPTRAFMSLVNLALKPPVLCLWLGLNLVLPGLLYRWSTSMDEVLATLPPLVLTLLLWGLMNPFYAMEGCLDMSELPQISTGVWLTGCLLAMAVCGGLASLRGSSPGLFASLGLLLGLGAVPVTWWATRKGQPGEPGIGLSPQGPAEEGPACEQRAPVLMWGLCAGLIALLGHLFLLSSPLLGLAVPDSWCPHNLYLDRRVQLAWTGLMLVAPVLTYRGLNCGIPPVRPFWLLSVYFLVAGLACGGTWALCQGLR